MTLVVPNIRVLMKATMMFFLTTPAFSAPSLRPHVLDPQKVQELTSRQHNKALRLAVQSVGVRALLSTDNVLPNHNTSYTTTLTETKKVNSILNQKQTGRCWAFAYVSQLKTVLFKKGLVPADFELSASYVHFMKLLEDSNSFLNNFMNEVVKANGSNQELLKAINPNIADGGWYSDFWYIVDKYGIVPANTMPDTAAIANDSELLEHLNLYLKKRALEMIQIADEIRGLKPIDQQVKEERASEVARVQHPELANSEPPPQRSRLKKNQIALLNEFRHETLRGVVKILTSQLGVPPQEFSVRVQKSEKLEQNVRDEKFTPRSFAQWMGRSGKDFINVSFMPSRPMHQTYMYVDNSNQAPMKFLNLPIKRLIELVSQSLRSDEGVYFAADISQHADHQRGILHTDIKNPLQFYGLGERARPKTFGAVMQLLAELKGANHAMLFVAEDQPPGAKLPIKFKLENSWGVEAGDNGYYHMYLNWFKKYVEFVTIQKEFLTPEEIALWENNNIEVGPEDLFQ